MTVSSSELRADIYRLLDQVLETGVPLEVERKGRRLRITAEDSPSKLARLVPHPEFMRGDPEELVETEWPGHWNPEPA